MELRAGQTAVVTGAAGGIGLALAERFGREGLNVVLADIDGSALASAGDRIAGLGVGTLTMHTDVSDAEAIRALADAAVERFGSVHVVCNNAGVTSKADPWFGPLSAWTWVLGVNLWGVIHGIRTFLPVMIGQGKGHIVNTASILGLMPYASPSYDSSKHAVVALTEDLFKMTKTAGLPIGVSLLCPGSVRTGIFDSERNWPTRLGDSPPPSLASTVLRPHYQRLMETAMSPDAIADLVADAIVSDRFWVLPQPEFVELAARRWQRIADGNNPETEVDMPGFPPANQIAAEIRALVSSSGSTSRPMPSETREASA